MPALRITAPDGLPYTNITRVLTVEGTAAVSLRHLLRERGADAAGRAYIAQLNDSRVFGAKIVTPVVPLAGFYYTKEYHQHRLDRNPDNPYIVNQDMPEIASLERQYPGWLKEH